MRVQAGLRISVRGSDHVLRRPVSGGRVPEHCQRQGVALRSVPVPIGWRLGHQVGRGAGPGCPISSAGHVPTAGVVYK